MSIRQHAVPYMENKLSYTYTYHFTIQEISHCQQAAQYPLECHGVPNIVDGFLHFHHGFSKLL